MGETGLSENAEGGRLGGGGGAGCRTAWSGHGMGRGHCEGRGGTRLIWYKVSSGDRYGGWRADSD